jgi:hypothetical protein
LTLPALIIIDMQRGVTSTAAGARNSWRDKGATVVHVRHISRTPGSLFWPGQVASDATYAFDKIDYAGTPRTAAEVHAMALAIWTVNTRRLSAPRRC